MRIDTLAGLAVAALAVVTSARADEPRFGRAGELAISDDQPLGGGLVASLDAPTVPGATSTASFELASVSGGGGSGVEFMVAPAADYFVIKNLSVGGNLQFGVFNFAHGTGNGPGDTATYFGIAPRVGYNVAITDSLSIWPKLYFAFATVPAGSGGGQGATQSSIGVFAPFVFAPVPHFFVGIGPNFSTQLSNSGFGPITGTSGSKVTQVGIQATVGGWLFGD
jgi:hypothetical protein